MSSPRGLTEYRPAWRELLPDAASCLQKDRDMMYRPWATALWDPVSCTWVLGADMGRGW